LCPFDVRRPPPRPPIFRQIPCGGRGGRVEGPHQLRLLLHRSRLRVREERRGGRDLEDHGEGTDERYRDRGAVSKHGRDLAGEGGIQKGKGGVGGERDTQREALGETEKEV